MKDRNDKINEAKRLLAGEPPQGKPRTWVVTCYDGKEECTQPGWPDEVQEHDKILRIIEPGAIDEALSMITPEHLENDPKLARAVEIIKDN
jgi:hypothetical protein